MTCWSFVECFDRTFRVCYGLEFFYYPLILWDFPWFHHLFWRMVRSWDERSWCYESLVCKYCCPEYRFVCKVDQLLFDLEQKFVTFQLKYRGYVRLCFWRFNAKVRRLVLRSFWFCLILVRFGISICFIALLN